MSDIDVVRSIYDAYRRRDFEGFMGLLHPDIEIYQTEEIPWGGRYHGTAGAQEFFGKLTSYIDSVVDVEELLEAGERVVEIGHSRGQVKKTGNEFDVRAVHVWEIREGKAVALQAHIDTPEMLRALQG